MDDREIKKPPSGGCVSLYKLTNLMKPSNYSACFCFLDSLRKAIPTAIKNIPNATKRYSMSFVFYLFLS